MGLAFFFQKVRKSGVGEPCLEVDVFYFFSYFFLLSHENVATNL